MTSQDTLAVVGDVHGEPRRLERVLKRLLKSDLEVVLVGDYVNRGPDSRAVLDQLVQARFDFGERLTMLRGNHDQTLLNFLHDGDPQALIAHEGVPTVRAYLKENRGGFAEFRAAFPPEHLALLSTTIDYYETEMVLVSHAGFNPKRIESRHPSDMRGVGFPAMFGHTGDFPRQLTVCGHFIQRDGRPYISDRLVCIDTGCGSLPDGALTTFYWPSRHIESI